MKTQNKRQITTSEWVYGTKLGLSEAFWSCKNDLEPDDLELDIMKMYSNSENEVCTSRHSNVRAQIGQTDTDVAQCITKPHLQTEKYTTKIKLRPNAYIHSLKTLLYMDVI